MTHKITGEHISAPCGKCPNCYKRRVSQWSFRLMQEEKRSTSAHFITLTYDTSHVPITDKRYMSLDKRDTQLFFKRLRKCPENISSKIKYYCVGEYGGKTERPHYHIILYNAAIETIQRAWQLGSVHYGTITGASIGYTLKYISKRGNIPKHNNDDRKPQFGNMSKGLGANYLTESMKLWHHADKLTRMYCNLKDGKKIAMPRYYKNKIYEEKERKIIGVHVRSEQLKKQENAPYRCPTEKVQRDIAAFKNMQLKSFQNQKI